VIKRLGWFVAGTLAGAAGGLYGRRKVVQAADRIAPTNVAKRTVVRARDGIRDRGRDVVEAVREGRDGMRAKEAELRAAAEGHPVVTASPGRQIVEVRVVEQLDDWRSRRSADLPAAVPDARVRRVRRRGRR
jgi:hypothetical protein